MMTATTRDELMKRATDKPVPGSKELVTAINEAKTQLDFAQMKLNQAVTHAQYLKDNVGHYAVNSSVVGTANEYDVAAGKLNTLFLTLACVLEANGIPVQF